MILEGKVAIVTGASRGIGRQIATQIANLGAKVVVNYATNRSKADKVVEDITNFGSEAVAIRADVSKVSDIEELFAETLELFGKVDILINNAGILENALLSDVTEDDFDKHFAINVKGTYFACQQAMKHMVKGGKIINFSTSVSSLMVPSYSVYAATKGAVEQITRQLAKEFGPKGISINCIAPGPVNTEMFSNGRSVEQEFLVSEQSRWITGQTIRLNGGYI